MTLSGFSRGEFLVPNAHEAAGPEDGDLLQADDRDGHLEVQGEYLEGCILPGRSQR